MFDLDRSKADENQEREAEQQKMRALGDPGEPEPGVHDSYACWHDNLTAQIREDLGDAYDGALAHAADTAGYAPSKGRKVPVVVHDMLQHSEEAGNVSPTITSTGERLKALIVDQ